MDAWAQRFTAADVDLTDVYETVLVPQLFAPWAEVLLDAVAPPDGAITLAGATLLDVATGPGTVARAAARRVGRIGRVIGCDPSAGMLAAARRHDAEPAAAPIDYRECAAHALTVDDASVDLVTCQHGLQFFPDRTAALADMRRATRPGGRLGLAVWAGIEHSALFSAIALGVASSFGGDAARGYVAGPWSLGDPDELARLASAAGWQDVTVVPYVLPVEFPGGAAQLVATLGVTPLGARVAALDPPGRQHLLDGVTHALGDALDSDGAARAPGTAHFLLASA